MDKQDQHSGTGKIQEVDDERKKLLLKIYYTLGIWYSSSKRVTQII